MGFAAGLGGLLGGAAGGGGLLGTLSTIGSVISAISSFIPKDTPDVPMPPPVNLGATTPIPEAQPADTPADILTEDQKQQMADNEKRRRAILQGNQSDESKIAGELSTSAKVTKKTLLGE